MVTFVVAYLLRALLEFQAPVSDVSDMACTGLGRRLKVS